MSEGNFEKLIQEAILLLPKHIREKMDNVAVTIAESPTAEQLKKIGIKYKGSLLGLYEGVPKTTWGRGFGQRLPDKITIFQEPIEKLANNEKEIMEVVKNTVWHEIAHHFGLNEEKIRSLEPKWKQKI